MDEYLKKLAKYEHISVRLMDFPERAYVGQYRGRIQDVDHCYYDNNGSAIWVTLDSGFELFTEIYKISSIVTV